VVFWDTSALVKAYATEPGSPIAQAALKAVPARRAAVSDFVALETLSVLAKLLRTGAFSAAEYRAVRGEFFKDYPGSFVEVSVEQQTHRIARALVETHRKAGIGALDILHLACALDLKAASYPRPVVFAVVDGPLRRVAKQEGLRTFDPETQTGSDLLAAMR
jgi:predicted nucleic acid-binding protein